MPPSLSELKVLPSFCFAFIIPDDRAVTSIYGCQLHPKIAIYVVKQLKNDSFH